MTKILKKNLLPSHYQSPRCFCPIAYVYLLLECMDAARRVAHPSRTWRDAGRGVRGGLPRASAASEFFFSRILAESASIRDEPGWFSQNRAISGRIGRRPIRPKQAEISLETRRSNRNSDLRCVSCLLLSLFCESSILMCFLRIF